jgi:hypothetical protein
LLETASQRTLLSNSSSPCAKTFRFAISELTV